MVDDSDAVYARKGPTRMPHLDGGRKLHHGELVDQENLSVSRELENFDGYITSFVRGMVHLQHFDELIKIGHQKCVSSKCCSTVARQDVHVVYGWSL